MKWRLYVVVAILLVACGSEAPSASMVTVPPGQFQMGCDESNPIDQCKGDQVPLHTVYLDAYRIDIHEVTNEQYAGFLNARGGNDCDGYPCLDLAKYGGDIDYEDGAFIFNRRADYDPVSQVTWYGADVYCNEIGKRLPTEAEWEKAARGSADTRFYPWGDEPEDCRRANFDFCANGRAPVNSHPSGASPYGALNMAGNVWEWVSDWYDYDYYDISPAENPTGPETGYTKVARGGSYEEFAGNISVSYRYDMPPAFDWAYLYTGFRCAADAE